MTSKTLLLVLCSLSLVLTLNTTLEKNYFFLSPANRINHELFQTRSGIIAHSTKYYEYYESGLDTYLSKYVLIDLNSQNASPILSNLVKTCENAFSPFKHLHYHAQTESLVYFCSANSSLLFIDQPSFTVRSAISFNTDSTWPVATLSTDGMSVSILTMGMLYNHTNQTSALFTVNLQTKKLTTQIVFDQNLTDGEAVVAYATGKTGSYIATNTIQGHNLFTNVYSLTTIGNKYQIAPIIDFTDFVPYFVLTKLYCLGDFIAINSGELVNFISKQGFVFKTIEVRMKYVTIFPETNYTLYDPSFTSQGDLNYLYLFNTDDNANRFSAMADTLLVKDYGTFGEMNIAYGNSTTPGDLMFALDLSKVWFTITDIQTGQIIYNHISGYSDIMLTENTYAVVQGVYNMDYYLHLFDLKTDTLMSKIPINLNRYFYNKEQQIVTYLNLSMGSECAVAHIDLASGKFWNTLTFSSDSDIYKSSVISARITENGNPEVVLSLIDHYLIITETYGQLIFKTNIATGNFDNFKINFEDLSIYYLVSDQLNLNVNASYYTFDPKSKQFQLKSSKIVSAESMNHGLFTIDSTMSLALSPETITLIDGLSLSWYRAAPQNYNFASSFTDSEGQEYAIVATKDLYGPHSLRPSMISIGNVAVFTSLPGTGDDTNSARATGLHSYAVSDDISQAIGNVRFYNAAGSHAKQTLISI